jgi:serine phosphatase RsbU (regulator of sigma subunit)/DNA-binding NarL/FixJ family response regulator
LILQSSITSQVTDHLKVLLLEDYALDAELLIQEIHSQHPGWTVKHVIDRDGFEHELKCDQPDLVISDYSLPQYNALEALITVKALGLEIPFIIVTGDLPEEAAAACIAKGVDDYVIKSALPRLNVAIANALRKQESRRNNQRIQLHLATQEARYQEIFNNAGVAICHIDIPNLAHILDHRDRWRKAKAEDITRQLACIVARETNAELLKLFEAESADQFAADFSAVWNPEELAALRFAIRQISRGAESFEDKALFKTLLGGSVYLHFKFNKIDTESSGYIVTFTDLTEVQRSEKRLNHVIAEMEDTVTSRTKELKLANDQLQHQASERERMNTILRENYIHTTESIIAAKRIQQLMLPSKQTIADAFTDVFVYLRPKDIVSGDFYWFYRKENRCWIAAVDCTGHGVPGAFMSMIGTNVLNQVVLENNTCSTSEILAKIDELVIRELKQNQQGTEVSTGMDISLCSFDFETMEMRYSGAFHQLYRIRDGVLETLKGDRFSLGGTFNYEGKSFAEHRLQLKKDDRIYMTTDGFLDQFGGPKCKKFTRKRFMTLLQSLKGTTMYDQEVEVKSALQDWKGTDEQIDDILVIGIRV